MSETAAGKSVGRLHRGAMAIFPRKIDSFRDGRRRSAGLIALAISVAIAIVFAPPSPASATEEASSDKLRRLLAPAQAAGSAHPATPEDRERLIAEGEAALREGDAARAAESFERAGFVRHAADAELGLIHAYMQAGQYRRALMFGAHTAGAHPEVGAGAGLYAWLLRLGGQSRAAERTLERARLRLPDDPLLERVATRIADPESSPDPVLRASHGRFAPYSHAVQDFATFKVVASGAAVSARQVIASSARLEGAHSIWVRNGVGTVRRATLARVDPDNDLVELVLEAPLHEVDVIAAPRDPFPGAPAFPVEFPAAPAAEPVWPVARVGFLGALSADSTHYRLGIALSGVPGGGPVFDAAGRLVGLGRRDASGEAQLVPISRLQNMVRITSAPLPAGLPATRVPLDAIYERSLLIAVQVLARSD